MVTLLVLLHKLVLTVGWIWMALWILGGLLAAVVEPRYALGSLAVGALGAGFGWLMTGVVRWWINWMFGLYDEPVESSGSRPPSPPPPRVRVTGWRKEVGR